MARSPLRGTQPRRTSGATGSFGAVDTGLTPRGEAQKVAEHILQTGWHVRDRWTRLRGAGNERSQAADRTNACAGGFPFVKGSPGCAADRERFAEGSKGGWQTGRSAARRRPGAHRLKRQVSEGVRRRVPVKGISRRKQGGRPNRYCGSDAGGSRWQWRGRKGGPDQIRTPVETPRKIGVFSFTGSAEG